MKIKDLFGVLLTSQQVLLYNACGVPEWEGEFKHVPHRYFECIIINMYSRTTIDNGSFIEINFKKNYTRGWREVVCDARTIFRSS